MNEINIPRRHKDAPPGTQLVESGRNYCLLPAKKPEQIWLNNTIVKGIQMLLAVGLENTPARDTMAAVTKTWVMLFSRKEWDRQIDQPRIMEAFLKAAETLQKWPSPAKVLEFLPHVHQEPEPIYPKKGVIPAEIKALIQQFNESNEGQIKSGNLKPIYRIDFYLPPTEGLHYRVFYQGPDNAPRTVADQFIESFDDFLQPQAKAVGGKFTRKIEKKDGKRAMALHQKLFDPDTGLLKLPTQEED